VSIPVVARSKVWLYGCSLAGNAVSIPTVGMGVPLGGVVCCQIEACPMDRSFAQGSPTDCSVYESDFET
jgi:hypothetical protein